MNVRDFWLKIRATIEAGVHRFAMWFQLSVRPDLLEFLEDNRELAMETALEVARDLAGLSGAEKRDEAFNRIMQRLMNVVPDLEIDASWINLLIEVAVAVLKAKGRI